MRHFACIVGAIAIVASTAFAETNIDIPPLTFGLYHKAHEIRISTSSPCKRDTDKRCLAKVYDEVSIAKVNNTTADVHVLSYGGFGHSCEITGRGSWDGHSLSVTTTPEGSTVSSCVLTIRFDKAGISEVEAITMQACLGYCGAGASPGTDGLKRVRP
jgi:hypothetical protein